MADARLRLPEDLAGLTRSEWGQILLSSLSQGPSGVALGCHVRIHESQPFAGRFLSVKEAPLFAASAVALCCEHLPSVVSVFPSDTYDR